LYKQQLWNPSKNLLQQVEDTTELQHVSWQYLSNKLPQVLQTEKENSIIIDRGVVMSSKKMFFVTCLTVL